MIEQERAVQFRFDTGAKGHSEKIAEINLPSCARVFSCVGLPNIFAWKNIEHSESFQETWLFIPDSALNRILSANTILDRSSEGNILSAIAIQLDNQILFPVHNYGKVSCIVAVPDGKQASVTPVDLEKLKQMGQIHGTWREI